MKGLAGKMRQRGMGKALGGSSLRWTALFAALVVGATLLQRNLAPPVAYIVHVPTEDASGLYPGTDVMIAGARAGTIQEITLRTDGLVDVAASIDPAHAPVRSDATASIRPKSLLGEQYLALDPGRQGDPMPSGWTLPRLRVTRSTDLEQVVNTFDEPTREKLRTVIVELGGGLAGRGAELNQGLRSGRQDLDDLAQLAQTLARREQQLRQVIADLAQLLELLARSDRRQQLAELIQNSEILMKNLADQDRQLKLALEKTNAALGRTATGLGGTQSNLESIAQQLPYTVHQGDLILADLALDSTVLMPHLGELVTGIQAGPAVFGGRDANGYATRIALVVGTSSLSGAAGLALPPGQLPQPAAAADGAGPVAGPSQAEELRSGILGFLLGATP